MSDDSTPISTKLDAAETDDTLSLVLEHVLGEVTAAVVRCADLLKRVNRPSPKWDMCSDLLSQLEHVALDIQAVLGLHKSSMLPSERSSIPDTE